MTGFQRLCIVTCFVVFGLIVLGGVVRSTDSGEGCPDWPTCHGRLIPRTDKHTLIEYSHRATASVTGLLVLAIAIGAWRAYRTTPRVLYPALLALVLVIFQAGLGGAAVLSDLAAEVVMVHLGTALTILALLILLTMTLFDLRKPLARIEAGPSVRRQAAIAAVVVMALMVIGAYVAVADYSLACAGWPLCNGDVIPDTSATSVQVIFLHRALALVAGLVILGLLLVAGRERARAPLAFALAAAAATVYGVQVIIGAANIWTQVADEVSTAHLAFGTLLWVVIAVLNIRVFHLYDLLPRAVAGSQPSDLARLAR